MLNRYLILPLGKENQSNYATEYGAVYVSRVLSVHKSNSLLHFMLKLVVYRRWCMQF